LKETKIKKKRRRRRKKDMYDVPAKLWKEIIDIYRSINDRQDKNLEFCQREKSC
jgi:hypothetical protein